MLVLSRKVGESIVIGGDVILKVLEVRGRQIRLGIEAPKDRFIRRVELPQDEERRPKATTGQGVVPCS